MGYLIIYQNPKRIYLARINFLSLSLPISPNMRVGCFEWEASPTLLRLGPPCAYPNPWMTTHIRVTGLKEKKSKCDTNSEIAKPGAIDIATYCLSASTWLCILDCCIYHPVEQTKGDRRLYCTFCSCLPFAHVYEPRTEKEALGPATMIVRCMHLLMLTYMVK